MPAEHRPGQAPVVLVAHGTRNPAGRAVIGSLVEQVRSAGLDARLAHVDVHPPFVTDVIARCERPPVVVPLLLSVGYHVRVDIAGAVQARPGTRVRPPLGPDALLAEVLAERLDEAGLRPDDAVVLVAAGSSDPTAKAACERQADLLGRRIDRPVSVGFVAAEQPSASEAVAAARATGRRVVLASYLLAPGHFQTRLDDAGADLVSAPLGAHPLIAELVLRRVAMSVED